MADINLFETIEEKLAYEAGREDERLLAEKEIEEIKREYFEAGADSISRFGDVTCTFEEYEQSKTT